MSESDTPDAAPGGASQAGPAAEPLAPLVGQAMREVLGILQSRGKEQVGKIARQGRDRLEVFQAKRDLDRLYQKLGREVERLIEAGEVTHPGLVTGVDRIRQQRERVETLSEADSGQLTSPE